MPYCSTPAQKRPPKMQVPCPVRTFRPYKICTVTRWQSDALTPHRVHWERRRCAVLPQIPSSIFFTQATVVCINAGLAKSNIQRFSPLISLVREKEITQLTNTTNDNPTNTRARWITPQITEECIFGEASPGSGIKSHHYSIYLPDEL